MTKLTKSRKYSVYKKERSLFVEFKQKTYKINIDRTNLVLSKIINQKISIKNEEQLYCILEHYHLFDEVFLEYISL